MFTDDWNKLGEMIENGRFEAAESLAKSLHRSLQPYPLEHARIHFIWGRIKAMKGQYLHAVMQWLIAIVFAVPVSLFQKLFHHRGDDDR